MRMFAKMLLPTLLAAVATSAVAEVKFNNTGSSDLKLTVTVQDAFESFQVDTNVKAGGSATVANNINNLVFIGIKGDNVPTQYFWPGNSSIKTGPYRDRPLFSKLSVDLSAGTGASSCSIMIDSGTKACDEMYKGGIWDCSAKGSIWARQAQPQFECQ